MSTTQSFQTKSNYYKSPVDAKLSLRHSQCTNPRYPHFRQTHFTAGDFEQFDMYRDSTPWDVKDVKDVEDTPTENKFKSLKCDDIKWERYESINGVDVTNTFRYLFNKFKKGIFVKIKNNTVRVFLPFSKNKFKNEWSDRINLTNKQKVDKKISNVQHWYANNGILRNESPIYEGDTNVGCMKDMLDELCLKRCIPDVEFFLNRRDFPLLTRDMNEPYGELWDGDSHPLVSHKYTKYAPVLSMSTRDTFADIPIPTSDDWASVNSRLGKYFPKCRKDDVCIKHMKWCEKKSVAVFRGSSTGMGVTPETNSRLKLAKLSNDYKSHNMGSSIDAGITSWNLRVRKVKGSSILQTQKPETFSFGLAPRMSPLEQSRHKYIINIDGHVSAFRLSHELSMGCCILIVQSTYKLWYHKYLKPYIHYVPVKGDLSDLLDIVEWCKNNDKKCETIAIESKGFHDSFLTRDGILDYLQKTLIECKRQSGRYDYSSYNRSSDQLKRQLSICKSLTTVPETHKSLSHLSHVPIAYMRSWSLSRGLQYIVHFIWRENSTIEENSKPLDKRLVTRDKSNITYRLLAGHPITLKTVKKESLATHESFIGLSSINSLARKIPNFSYTYGLENKLCIVKEYIDGVNMYEWIGSPTFNIGTYINIMTQVALALQIAQNDTCFVHWDLAPWNIILKEEKSPITNYYATGIGVVWKLKTNIIPVIIDYEKSHVVYKNIHYGQLHPVKTETMQDIFHLLILTLWEIQKKYLTVDEKKALLDIANFLHVSGRIKNPFLDLTDLRTFLIGSKDYSSLVYENETYAGRPVDFVHYIREKTTCRWLKEGKYAKLPFEGSPIQVFHYTLSTTEKERKQTYVNAINQSYSFGDFNYRSVAFWAAIRVYIKKKTLITLSSYESDNSHPNTIIDSIIDTSKKICFCKGSTLQKQIFFDENDVIGEIVNDSYADMDVWGIAVDISSYSKYFEWKDSTWLEKFKDVDPVTRRHNYTF